MPPSRQERRERVLRQVLGRDHANDRSETRAEAHAFVLAMIDGRRYRPAGNPPPAP